MHPDERELFNRLFAAATARLEDATETTVAGQSSKASNRQYRSYAENLARIADDLGHIARAAQALTHPNPKIRKIAKNVR